MAEQAVWTNTLLNTAIFSLMFRPAERFSSTNQELSNRLWFVALHCRKTGCSFYTHTCFTLVEWRKSILCLPKLWKTVLLCLTPYPAEIMHLNWPDRKLSNEKWLVPLHQRKLVVHTWAASHLSPIIFFVPTFLNAVIFFHFTSHPAEITYLSSANRVLCKGILVVKLPGIKIGINACRGCFTWWWRQLDHDEVFPAVRRVIEFRARYRWKAVHGF